MAAPKLTGFGFKGVAGAMSLRGFVEHASNTLEKVFVKTGIINPMFHVIQRNGKEFALPGNLSDDKDMMCAIARKAFEMCDVVRYLYVDEAWIVEAIGPEAERIVRETVRMGARNHPLRKEVIMLSAEDEDEGQLLARRLIIRPATGPAYLGPLEIDTETVQSEGRFVGLLPRREKTMH